MSDKQQLTFKVAEHDSAFDQIHHLNYQAFVKEIRQRIEYRLRIEVEESQLFRTMAKFAPAFGMIGTRIGLIGMLSNMGADETIGRMGGDMAVALVTTFYGLILANFVFIPFSTKLENRTRE